VFGKHAVQFAAFAGGVAKYPQLDRLLAGGGDRRNSAAVIFGQLMNGFNAGLNQSQASFRAQAHDQSLAAQFKELEARVFTDFLRGVGVLALIGSSWVTAGTDIPIGFGVKATGKELTSLLGRIGLFSGSVGTLLLDRGQKGQVKTEAQAVQIVEQGMKAADVTPTQALQQMYNGWFSNISQLPGKEGQRITDGVMTGSSFAGAPTIQTDVQSFYVAYNPMDYYFRQTGQFPPAS